MTTSVDPPTGSTHCPPNCHSARIMWRTRSILMGTASSCTTIWSRWAGMVGCGRIELLPERVTADIERELVVSAPLDPLARRRHGGALAHLVEQGRERLELTRSHRRGDDVILFHAAPSGGRRARSGCEHGGDGDGDDAEEHEHLAHDLIPSVEVLSHLTDATRHKASCQIFVEVV